MPVPVKSARAVVSCRSSPASMEAAQTQISGTPRPSRMTPPTVKARVLIPRAARRAVCPPRLAISIVAPLLEFISVSEYSSASEAGGPALRGRERRTGEEGEPDHEADDRDDRGGDEEPLDRIGAGLLARLVALVAQASVPGGAVVLL